MAGADVAARIEWATRLVAGRDEAEATGLIYTLVGTSLATQESVPAAFAVLAVMPADPWRACLLAASLGGDCDTIAAMAGAVRALPRRRGLPARRDRRIDAHGLGLAGQIFAARSGDALRGEAGHERIQPVSRR